MGKTADLASFGILGIALFNFILSLVIGVSMKFLWNLFATMQIITHMGLINMPLPSHLTLCLATLIDIANLNMIPKDNLKAVLDKFVISEIIAQKN